ADPQGIEGPPAKVDGLGMLDIETVLEGDKVLVEVSGTLDDVPFTGYEMHVGRTIGKVKPLLHLNGHDEGTDAGRIVGCYIHGLLADDRQRRHWLQRLDAHASSLNYQSEVEAALDQLADHLEEHIDCERLLGLARTPKLSPAN